MPVISPVTDYRPSLAARRLNVPTAINGMRSRSISAGRIVGIEGEDVPCEANVVQAVPHVSFRRAKNGKGCVGNKKGVGQKIPIKGDARLAGQEVFPLRGRRHEGSFSRRQEITRRNGSSRN